MNASPRLFVMSRRLPAAGPVWAVVCVATLLSGCATSSPFTTGAVDPSSPIAADLAARAAVPGPYPTFAGIPAMPSDVRPLPAFGQAATSLEMAGIQLTRDTRPETWTITGTEAFAGRARDLAGPAVNGMASTTAATEAFAKAQRARATPPPPPR